MSLIYIKTCEHNFKAFVQVMETSQRKLKIISKQDTTIYKSNNFTIAKSVGGTYKIRKDKFVEFAINYSHLMRVTIA